MHGLSYIISPRLRQKVSSRLAPLEMSSEVLVEPRARLGLAGEYLAVRVGLKPGGER